MTDPIRLTLNETLSAAIARAIRAGRDFTPAMRSIAGILEEAMQYRFETSTAPDGTPWQPSRRAAATGGKTLVDKARLLGSITSAHGATHAEAGTNVIYAAIHNFGGRTGRGGATVMPKRQFAGFAPEDIDAIEDVLGRHLARALGGAA